MGKVYKKEYEIYYYDVDSNLNCTMSKILGILSDIGSKQSEELGSGIGDLIKDNMTWVFYNYDIKVKRYPKYEEKIKVLTESKGFKKFYALRNYQIIDEKGEIIVEGNAIFLLINLEKRRAIRIPKEQYEVYGVEEDLKEDFIIPKIKLPEEYDYEDVFKVRYADIDSNKHVNNTKYIEWAVETLPEEMVYNYKLEEINVIFEKECRYGEEVKIMSKVLKEEDGRLRTMHKISTLDGRDLTKLEGKWTLEK